MADRHYDVVVLGRSLGALVAAALLARRDFTVLVVGQGQPPARYGFEGRSLRRSAFGMLWATSPAWRRVLVELAQTQTWKQKAKPIVPMLQVLMPSRRFEIPPNAALFRRELEREFPEVRRLVADLHADTARVMLASDAAFGKDVTWPPGAFLERREAGRIVASLPYARAEAHVDLLSDFPLGHPYRRIATHSVRFATSLAREPPAFAMARLYGSWTREPVTLRGGDDDLEQLLLERIAADGGRHVMQERAVALVARRRAVVGVELDGDASPVGAGFVISDMTGEQVASLAGGLGLSKSAEREWPRITPAVGRFVASLVVRNAGVPSALGPECLLLPEHADDERLAPPIRLQRAEPSQPGETLLVAELLLTERGELGLKDAREHVVSRLCAELPFLERHLVLVDSVHDGLPLWLFEEGRRTQVERAALREVGARTESLAPQFDVDPPGYLGLAGEPVRGPIDRTLLVGPSVLPGLGGEGQLLAAWSAARLVTRTDRRKARMRREMWTKIEIS